MAKQIAGVSEKVLHCARKEFLEKGFLDASLREIAKEAETSTGSIYTRFGDKEGLFRALVEPFASELKKMFLELQETAHGYAGQAQYRKISTDSRRSQEKVLDYIYDHFDACYLLIQAAHGTEYAGFIDDLAELEEAYTYRYLKHIGNGEFPSGAVTRDFIHILATAYCEGIFEPVRHRMPREKAKEYIWMFGQYHASGFQAIFDTPLGA